MQIPEENVLANALAVVATCAQSTYSVELYGTSTIQTTNLFIMSPLPPTSRKRACLKACLNPVRDWEEAQVRKIGPRITQENIQKMITRRSIRSLAKDLRISVITTKRAYDELEREGFVYTVPGKGCFVAAKNVELLREEHLKKIEALMGEILSLGAACNLSKAELAEMFRLMMEE